MKNNDRQIKRLKTGSIALLSGLCLSLSTAYAQQTEEQPTSHASNYENQLITSLQDIQEQRVDGAMEKIESLVQNNPKFKLAQLIYGDLLLAKAGAINDFGNPFASLPASELAGLRNEAQARWQHYASHPDEGMVPAYLLQLNPEIKHAIVIDLNKSRLYLYENNNGELNLLSDYYVSIGKNGAVKQREGDKRTPIGVYHITDFLSPNKLPDFYGSGAFPINYPNSLDKIAGKTGYGIWLHGTPTNTYSRRPRASDGCVTLSNNDLETIKPLLKTGQTPVIIAEAVNWVKSESITEQGQHFSAVLNSWLQDWQSLDTERYLSHYSLTFRNSKKDYAAWALHKRRVSKQKKFIEIELSDVNVFSYPGQENMRVINFRQNYRSNNYNNTSHKQQYWKQEDDGAWRIIYEGPA